MTSVFGVKTLSLQHLRKSIHGYINTHTLRHKPIYTDTQIPIHIL